MGTKLFDILSEIITRLIGVVNRVNAIASFTNRVDTRELLWTNPNPTAAFAGQIISGIPSTYDEYEIVFTGYTGQQESMKTTRIPQDYGGHGTGYLTYITGASGQTSGALYVFKRYCTIVTSGMQFGEVYSSCTTINNGVWARYTANTGIVPHKIYGIKFGVGA